MDQKSYEKLAKKIDKLMTTKSRIIVYNLNGGSAWMDYCTGREYDRLQKKVERQKAKLSKYNSLIADILLLILHSGFPIDDIINKYEREDIYDVLSYYHEELKEYISKIVR